ncbi:unnamed protein product [Phaedon cochleariae]|uniref:Major facilitator superfamily (MFS) profile domain-containing protein n=1 Tax=Phaedon cochleariae TaxID=80249 RepID=A0A9N9SI43_PHACE|nr:unnamed protein product [Phaedon cochleariae]
MIQQQSPPPPYLFLEDLLPKTGWGLYYKFMLAMACANSVVNAAAFMSLFYAIPLSTCENLVTCGILWGVHISFLLGKSCGGYSSNCLSDIYGRKRMITYSLLTIFVTTFTAAFAYNYYMIIVAAFFLGSGLDNNSCTVRIHLAEILPKHKRGFYLAVCDVFWTVGYLLMSVFAVTMQRPTHVEHRAVDMKLATWRVILALSGGFSLVLACCSALLEESPRYFLHAKKEFLAVLALKQFYAINRSTYGNSFEVKDQDLRYFVQDYGLSPMPEEVGGLNSVKGAFKLCCRGTKLSLSYPFRSSTVTLMLVRIPLVVFSSVNLNVLLAKLLSQHHVTSGLGVIYLDYITNVTMCSSFEDNKTLYGNFFVLAINIIVGQIIMLWFLDKAGRRLCLVIPMVVSGVFLVALDFVKDNMIRMIMSSFIIIGVASATTNFSVINIELFPTVIRGTANGVTNFFATILTIFILRFFHLFADWVFMVAGTMLIVASLVANCVDDLKKQPMVE